MAGYQWEWKVQWARTESCSLLYFQGTAWCPARSRCSRNVHWRDEWCFCIPWLLVRIMAQKKRVSAFSLPGTRWSWAMRAAGPEAEETTASRAAWAQMAFLPQSPAEDAVNKGSLDTSHHSEGRPLWLRNKNIPRLWLNVAPVPLPTRLVLPLGWGLAWQFLGL